MNSQEHYTPLHIIEMVREVLHEIDLDPCSSDLANETIKAKRYLTVHTSGLVREWTDFWGTPISVWCNPPGSRHIKPSLPMQFWERLTKEIDEGNVTHALYLAYSLEQLQQAQKAGYPPMAQFPLCIPHKRIAFINMDGNPQRSPTHGNVIVYVPGIIDNTSGFKRVFSQLGYVKI
ncbi:DNA N-6-adenine-methyltransferase [Nostoc sp. PA-18-2419]|uniref:DNA N-6-adenine-methyltransferase n=1 Tax=Nostoc sp. PA-18-2419 TaxID=2575443 RepID=UPI0016780D92|nr:DNA N-6-adenine-methyltransferase [Nostoc sp. PA-18-2419]